MAITVYYGSHSNTLIEDPQPLGLYLANTLINNPQSVLSCPAIKAFVKNTFIIKYPIDYQISWDGEDISSNMYGQKFFDQEIILRDVKHGFISLLHPDNIFYTDIDDLDMELLPAYFHKNEFLKSGFIIPGMFNIGKHLPRRVETAYKFAEKASVKINNNDAIFYIRFNTDKEINFKKFIVTEEYKKLISEILKVRDYTTRIHSLTWWYDLVAKNKYKKYFLKIIKKNLL
jgi:hypothetical protein